jgi:hypothetical protein
MVIIIAHTVKYLNMGGALAAAGSNILFAGWP